MYNFIKQLTEGTLGKTLEQIKLPYNFDSLDPSISADTMNYHYGKLYKGYVDKFNSGEGDANFNEAGAFLHRVYFSQFKDYTTGNQPTGPILEFIKDNYKSYDNFKDSVEKVAMSIQGSGWVYLAQDGKIKTIKNHQIKKDIVILIDWWEHAWALDYQSNKNKYLKNIWNIIDWPAISQRLV
jgi:Fe-Mn family superoxide dismutase